MIDDKGQIKESLNENFQDAIFSVEDGVVWVSGMNSNCASVARRMARELMCEHNIPVGLIYDDGSDRFGGVQFNWGEAA